ncbi:MAG: hypothetical protein FWD83_09720, partial [Promicromonosporaceae bacterium]|nr:hypothetical protein [Promicromonosporaceae bacterium]
MTNPFAVPPVGSVDRAALLERHSPRMRGIDPRSPLQIGNGDFAFTADVTGLQTFPDAYPVREGDGHSGDGKIVGTLLGTMSSWGWHSVPFDGPEPDIEVALRDYDVRLPGDVNPRKTIPYVDLKQEQWGGTTGEPDAREEWLRNNPHRLDLGRIGLWLPSFDEQGGVRPEMIEAIDQRLDLATGVLHSRFTVRGARYEVTTAVHPERDALAIRIERTTTGDAKAEPFGVRLAFPYGSEDWGNSQDWTRPEAHTTKLCPINDGYLIERTLDDTRYTATLTTAASIAHPVVSTSSTTSHVILRERSESQDPDQSGNRPELGSATPLVPHSAQNDVAEGVTGFAQELPDHELIVAADGDVLDLVVEFLPCPWFRQGYSSPARPAAPPQETAEVIAAASKWWGRFWAEGAAVSFAGTADQRAAELERRIVLSQYLIAVNSAGHTPPAETGLMLNSWRGKFHLEMHWWHAASLPLWGRPELLERSMTWYENILEPARETARRQGYAGARWPKQTDPSGRETPSSIGTFLIWQQPHPIYLAELLYRANPSENALRYWEPIIRETADFMASFIEYGTDGTAHLPAPLVPAQESYARERRDTCDPTFELAYWRFGLETAATWLERLSEPVPQKWLEVAADMRAPQEREGIYPAVAVEPFTIRTDHPSMLAALGVVPDVGLVLPEVMSATLDDVTGAGPGQDESWDWESTWGWDYPVGAMTAARLGRPADAVDWLLLAAGKNEYLPNGHNYQTPALPIYLPGNGGLLTAIAL